MSISVFARGRSKPELRVFDALTHCVHRVSEMCIRTEASEYADEKPYGAECGTLVSGMPETDAPINCLECIAGREALQDVLKRRLGL